jgi:hypothetical protein
MQSRVVEGQSIDDNRAGRGTGHRADGRSLRHDFSAMYVTAEPQTRLFWD